MGKKTKIRYLRPSVMWHETMKTKKRLHKQERSPLIDRGREASRLDENRLRVQARSKQPPYQR